MAVLEIEQSALARILAFVAMNGGRRDARCHKALHDLIGTMLGACEDERLVD